MSTSAHGFAVKIQTGHDGTRRSAFALDGEPDEQGSVVIDTDQREVVLTLPSSENSRAAEALSALLADTNAPEYGFRLRLILESQEPAPYVAEHWWVPWVLDGKVEHWSTPQGDIDLDQAVLLRRIHDEGAAYFASPTLSVDDDADLFAAIRWRSAVQSALGAGLDQPDRDALERVLREAEKVLGGPAPARPSHAKPTNNPDILDEPLREQEQERYSAHRRARLMEHVAQGERPEPRRGPI
jgi:hypothetical protein